MGSIRLGHVVAFVLLVALLWGLRRIFDHFRHGSWVAFAASRGYEVTGRFALRGEVDGVELHIDRTYKSRFHGKSHRRSEPYTRVRGLALDPVRVGVQAFPEGVLQFLGKVIGLQDVETGDPSFDDRFIVRSADPDAARALLVADIRVKLQLFQPGQLFDRVGMMFEYVNGQIEVHWHGTETDPEMLQRAVDVVIAAGRVRGSDVAVEKGPSDEGSAISTDGSSSKDEAAVATEEAPRPRRRRRPRTEG